VVVVLVEVVVDVDVEVEVLVEVDVEVVGASDVVVPASFLHWPGGSWPAGLGQLWPGGLGAPKLAGEITTNPKAASEKTNPIRPSLHTIPIASRCRLVDTGHR
jgi:hypothetical protein